MVTTTELVAIVALTLSTGVWIGWFVTRKKRDELVRQLSSALTEQAEKTTELAAAALGEQQKRIQVVEAIAIIERERDALRTKYWDCGLGHSAAQDMLMREIIRLRNILTKHKVPYKGNDDCAKAVEKFAERHLPPKISDRIGDGTVANLGTIPVDPTAQ
jgi:hypothetical protein